MADSTARKAPGEATRGEIDALKEAFLRNLFYVQGKFPALATRHDFYLALAYTVRDRLLARWIRTAAEYTTRRSRTVVYLSAEFLMGPHLGNNLLNLGIEAAARQAVAELGLDLDELLAEEPEPGLGNGGLGRLAACFLDSMATLQIPCLGYGIRYEFGIFEQAIVDGWQVERTDKWLRYGNPWEIARPEWAVEVKFGGHVEHDRDPEGRLRVRWVPARTVLGVPYDTPILGYRVNTANTLRLWRAEAPESFDFHHFNRGEYYKAVEQKVVSENLTKVLYPNDEPLQGKQLRLEQQYFFVSCSLQDMLRILRVQKIPVERLHEKFTVQLNDTHPAIAVAELMRLLVDERGMEWDAAWQITQRTFAYTNHTLLPEALERWPLALFGALLPRHLEIIYEINARFLDEVRLRYLDDMERIARLSLIDEQGERYVRMAHLATVGSHAVNGVAALHTELLKRDVLADFHALWPDKFHCVTNGVTPRRWLMLANPRLAALISEAIGEGWARDLGRLRALEPLAMDASFAARWRAVKQLNKHHFAQHVRRITGTGLDPDALFDVQVKRIHEYKRQHLNALHIVWLYLQMKTEPHCEAPPRAFIFAGKAAPGYHLAKLIIRLINAIAHTVNRDPVTRERLKVVFLPNFNVGNAQRIYPAADLSEQISTAGKEASGTGNMKFALNGALTLGTLDGANIELREAVGEENFFLFGHTAEEVSALQASGYVPRERYQADPILREVIDLIRSGFFSRGDTELFRPLVDNLLQHDPYLVLADFDAYRAAQQRVDHAWLEPVRWTRMSVLNVARSGWCSSDRSIAEYARDIWRVEPVHIPDPALGEGVGRQLQ
ncbi:MAG: glycogen/starch/alpha-glucan phosphorylase [Burkholderiales bacterium]|nr:glycogen/starch/alpha-glucan phosphorylase [Burkholderiales bacterium]